MSDKENFKTLCNAYTDDEVCNACCNNSVMAKQSCYVKPETKPEKSSYRRIPLSWNNDADDKVHPDHYKLDNGREVIDVIKMMLTEDELRGFCKGNYLKYILRAGKKAGESAETDRNKAAWYLDYLEKLDRAELLPVGVSELNFKYLDFAEKAERNGETVEIR